MVQWIPALLGTALALVVGVFNPAEAVWALGVVATAGAILVSFGVMAAVLDAAGFFRWAAFNLARRARGSGTLLFWQVALLGFLATLFLTNEGSLLLLTPLIAEVCLWLGLPPRTSTRYMTAATVTALVTGVAGGTTSLTGLVAMALAGMGAGPYLRLVFVPGLAGTLVCTLVLFLLARHCCSRPVAFARAPAPPPAPPRPWRRRPPGGQEPAGSSAVLVPLVKDWWLLRAAVLITVLTRLAGPVAEGLGVPVYVAPVAGAGLLLILAAARGALNTRQLWLQAPWPVFGFALGMLVLARALHGAGPGSWLQTLLAPGWPVEALGFGLAALAAGITAVPAVTLAHLAVAGLPPEQGVAGFVAAVLGAGYGGILNPFGSLAGLLWFRRMQRLGWQVTGRAYLAMVLVAVPPGLAAGLLCARWWLEFLGK